MSDYSLTLNPTHSNQLFVTVDGKEVGTLTVGGVMQYGEAYAEVLADVTGTSDYAYVGSIADGVTFLLTGVIKP